MNTRYCTITVPSLSFLYFLNSLTHFGCGTKYNGLGIPQKSHELYLHAPFPSANVYLITYGKSHGNGGNSLPPSKVLSAVPRTQGNISYWNFW